MSKREYLTLDDFDFGDRTVLLRLDINSPIHPLTKKIVNEVRIDRSLPTIRKQTKNGVRLVLMAHQGDTLDYQNITSLEQHAKRLAKKLKKKVQFIDDVAGPAARKRIRSLCRGEILLLDNVRYLTEEVSTFESHVKLTPNEMTHTYLVRSLAPLVDYYVNDAFAAAHRNSPSMVAFQELLPSAAGILYDREISVLTKVSENPDRPCVFVLGGAKISDAFGMMGKVLGEGSADYVLTTGVVGLIMYLALGKELGSPTKRFIVERGLEKFVEPAKGYLREYTDRLLFPVDFGVDDGGKRVDVPSEDLPVKGQIVDIGAKTVQRYDKIVASAGTVFLNGPAGIYEKPIGVYGTKELFNIIGQAKGYTVIGGGDTVTAATRLGILSKVDYVCTGGGALIRFLSGTRLPLVEAMKKARRRWAEAATIS